MLPAQTDLAPYREALLRHFPALRGATIRALAAGFDSIALDVALDVDDALVFRFPRHAAASASLAREAKLLQALHGRLSLPVPEPEWCAGPPPFSRHRKLPGTPLLQAGYAALPETARHGLAQDLGRFFAELHALDPALLRAAGATGIARWLKPDAILRQAWPRLAHEDRELAERTLRACAELPPDPGGEVYGFFDAHGWNLAFDADRQRLNGIYDFGDSGIGPCHEEFIRTRMIDGDLARRTIAAYEGLAGRALDTARIDLLTGAFFLSEIGGYAGQPAFLSMTLAWFRDWARDPARQAP